MLLHIGAFHLNVDSERSTPWHTIIPPARVLCVVLLVLAIVLTPNGRWWTWAVYATGIAFLLLLSRVTLPVLLRRLAVESSFVSVVLLGTVFRGGGEVLWHWGWLQVTTEGLMVLGSVICKALLCLLVLNLLSMTTPVPQLLRALTILKMPPLLVAIIASMYRYIEILMEEVESMKRAAAARNLMTNRHWARLVVGNMIGSLFIRTYERGDRIYQAMLARGYTGTPPLLGQSRIQRWDILALTLAALWALLGQSVYLFTSF